MKYINKLMLIFTICLIGQTNLQTSDLVVPESSLLGPQNSIQFKPADQFAGVEMVGNYFKNNATATINDPFEITDTCTFSFTDVQEGNIHNSESLQFIGSYTPKDLTNRINLYGILE